jgi:hypothetical protein
LTLVNCGARDSERSSQEDGCDKESHFVFGPRQSVQQRANERSSYTGLEAIFVLSEVQHLPSVGRK